MRITFVKVAEKDMEAAVEVVREFRKHYKGIKPHDKVPMGKKWLVWNTVAGNVTITPKP
jgi:hypothetical protein